jgi:hypothetical protein
MAEDEPPTEEEAALSEIYRLVEHFADAVGDATPDWCELARLARDFTARLEVRCRNQSA